jgi:hypothetical protein
MIQHLASSASFLPTDASALDASISALKSSISALESSIKTFEGASGFWERMAWSCAIAVGIGIVGEIVVIVHDFLEDRREWRRGIVRPPDHPTVWIFWFDIAATLLVLAGVFGEAGASMKLASINSELRSKTSELRAKSEKLLSLVTAVAGDAATNAGKAQSSADKASSDEQQLATKLSEATAMEEAEQARLEGEEKKTKDLQTKAIDTETIFEAFISEVTEDLAPLSINRKLFVSELKVVPSHTLIELWYDPNNFDTYVFASQLFDALGTGPTAEPGAGWDVVPPAPIPPNTKLPPHVPGTTVLRFTLNGRQQLVPEFSVPAPRIPSEPLIAQFDGSWAGGVTVLSNDTNAANLVGGNPGSPVSELNTALTASLSVPIVLMNQLWPQLGPNRIVIAITASPKIIWRQRPIVPPLK